MAAGTFTQITPGGSWHVATDATGRTVRCGADARTLTEVITTGVLPDSRVCADCVAAEPLSDRLPVSITAPTAGRLLASALVNGDSHPDLVILAATIADEQRRTIFLDDLRADLARDGYRFDGAGYLATVR